MRYGLYPEAAGAPPRSGRRTPVEWPRLV